jgi:assimilatory nitrate reductase electron transfer subunit
VVILGYGMAGARLADEIRRRDPAGDRVALTVIGEESHFAYNRVLLSAVVAGTMRPENVALHDKSWALRSRVDLRTGSVATRIDRSSRQVQLADGSSVDYDALVLATGSRPWLPPIEGLLTESGAPVENVVTFRTLDDCARILEAARFGAPVAVLGGGLLGLEVARGLAGRGNLVTVVHPNESVMDRQLDTGASAVLVGILGKLGVEFRLGVNAARYLPGDGLKLEDGVYVPADLVVVSTGVRPETQLAVAAGLTVGRGVVIDDSLRTSDGRIHAIGDCAQHQGISPGLVQPAWEQAGVLADLLTGTETSARYRGTPVITRLKARGVDLATLGEVHTEADDPTAEVVSFADATGGRYAKLVVRDDRVTGAIVLGFPDAAAAITQLYDQGGPVPSDRVSVLLGRALPGGAPAASSPADLPGSALVCRCNSVSKSRLVAAWKAGATNVPELVSATRATTGCGGCSGAVHGIADWLGAQ